MTARSFNISYVSGGLAVSSSVLVVRLSSPKIHSYFPVWIGQDHWKSFSLLTASSKPTNILICWCNTWMHLFLFSSLVATNIYLAHNYISDLLNIFWLDNFLGTWWYCDIVVTVGYKEWGYCCENESMLMILLITIWYSTSDIQ